ncbi:MAG: stage II sporulation protein SpoIID [Clostridiaceae bacterium BRH_c20a]|nr:MAG: stage II sporulation protein SpoIID [Clostridiaceae bacterium BRH_c20a]
MCKRVVIFVVMLSLILLNGIACTSPQKKPAPPQQQPTKEEPTISLYVAETGNTKEIKMESYLEGVVAAEMDVNWPLEALAAQAIIARTFTLEKIQEGGVKERGTDASTDINEFQAYDRERINDQVKKAVQMTRGEVAKYQGKFIKAWFFADGGGKTSASAEEGLGFNRVPTPYIKSVDDPGINITVEENKSWQVSFPLNEVQNAIQQVSGKAATNISSVSIAEKGPSGRATKIKVGDVVVSAPALRLALGSDKMRSALLTGISIQGGNLVIQGKGYGHGVGMSQWGARALAEQGKSPEDIVRYFFKDVEIVKEYK